jgi:hypothetical protein
MNDARFEFRLSGPQRRELDALASETGLSPSALARFGIHMVLQNRDALLQPRTPQKTSCSYPVHIGHR